MLRLFFSLLLLTLLVPESASAQAAKDSAEFEKCVSDNAYNARKLESCYMNEAKRYFGEIEEKYAQLSKLPKIRLIREVSGNPEEYFRKMLNAWKAYIKNYCDIYAVVYNNYSGDGLSYNRANCLYIMTKEQLNQIGEIQTTYYSNMAN